jgi:hypothetical protein
MAECRHGLDEKLCDVCTPKPQPLPPARAVRVAGPRRTDAPRTKSPSVRPRRHLIVRMTELGEVLDGAVDAGEWMTEPPVTGFDSVVLVAPTDDVTLVTLIAVANEPARDRVRGIMAGREAPRIGVYPPWFTRSDWASERPDMLEQ